MTPVTTVMTNISAIDTFHICKINELIRLAKGANSRADTPAVMSQLVPNQVMVGWAAFLNVKMNQCFDYNPKPLETYEKGQWQLG